MSHDPADPKNTCPRCGVRIHGMVCADCRDTDPAWFAMVGLYHAKSNKTGAKITDLRRKASA